MDEARLERSVSGLEPATEGWFVVNVADAAWWRNERFGRFVDFENRDGARFSQLGINVQVLEPGQAACMYHRETAQEDFLVLHGECLVVIENVERRLRAWDFVHCPPGTDHVFVGAGAGPCAILMVGVRSKDNRITYPVNELARRHGASVAVETNDPKAAYADCPKSERAPFPWPKGVGIR